jgi:hypothetical protein
VLPFGAKNAVVAFDDKGASARTSRTSRQRVERAAARQNELTS